MGESSLGGNRGAPAARTGVRPGVAAQTPVAVRVEALLREGRVADAILLAYRSAEEDVQKAFGLRLPKEWTHREFLLQYLRPDMGLVAEILPQLYAMFEPVRYGRRGDRPAPPNLVEIVRALYEDTPLRVIRVPALGGPPTAGPLRSGVATPGVRPPGR